MNGFGMTYCFGSLEGRKKRRFASKNMNFEFPRGKPPFLPSSYHSPKMVSSWIHPSW